MNTTRTKMKKQKTGSVCVQSFNSTIVCIERKMMTMKQCRLSEMLDENQNERKTVPCLNSSSYITFDLSLDQFCNYLSSTANCLSTMTASQDAQKSVRLFFSIPGTVSANHVRLHTKAILTHCQS